MTDPNPQSTSTNEGRSFPSDAKVEKALRRLIADLDYDLHKELDDPEDEGDLGGYPGIVRDFVEWLS